MRKSQPSIVICFIVALVLLSACGQRQQAPPPRAQEVAATTLQPQELELTAELSGYTAACHVLEIRPEVNGSQRYANAFQITQSLTDVIIREEIICLRSSDPSDFMWSQKC